MRLVCSISRNRCLSNRYQETAYFGHDVKRNQERGDKSADSRFSTNRFFPVFAAYLDVISIEIVEDLKIFLAALASFCLDDGLVQGAFQVL
jgi:hypothetical protein